MKRINARHFLTMTVEDMWDILTGSFVLVFDDGEITTNAKATIYSGYAWDFHRLYPDTPLLMKHHVDTILNGKRLGSDTHLELLGTVMWSVYDHLIAKGKPYIAQVMEWVKGPDGNKVMQYTRRVVSEIQLRDHLAELIYCTTNKMYNQLTYRCEEYVVSLDITDFIDVLNHPQIKQANETVEATQKSIDDTYDAIKDALLKAPELAHNPLALAARSKLANMNQILQCIGPRGYLTDIDSNLFYQPVLRGYASGLRLFHDSLIESRSAAKSLIFSKEPLQQAEYFSRRLQLMSQIVRNLHPGDCGTTQYVHWRVKPDLMENGHVKRASDLKQLVGKHYMDDDGVLKTISANDKHLIGKTIRMRSVIHCAHPDPYGICATCFGELSKSVPEGTNIGQMCCTSLAQKSSQNVLSVKHLDGSSVVEGIVLNDYEERFLKVAPDKNSYLLANELKGKQVKLIIRADQASNIIDIQEVKNVEDLSITRVSELDEIGILVTENGISKPIESIRVNLGRRMASMTYPFLKYVQKHGWGIEANGNYTFDLAEWDWSKPILSLPLKHFNMSDHSRDIAALLESSVDKLRERDENASPSAALVELFDLVNEKLVVNLAVLEVVLYASMVVSMKRHDYSLPKPWTTAETGVMKLSMAGRSEAPFMAYEGHREGIVNPLSYTHTNRPDHPMDAIVCPAEVLGGKTN